jgi:hypothetical protein
MVYIPPYDVTVIDGLPVEIRQLLDINRNINFVAAGMPTVEEILKDIPNDPSKLCRKMCVEVAKKQKEECRILRKRVEILLKRKGCRARVIAKRGTKCKFCR